jgi:hypothetical protein
MAQQSTEQDALDILDFKPGESDASIIFADPCKNRAEAG